MEWSILIVSTEDTWKFVATDRAALVDTMRQDGDYLVMGWWLEAPAHIHW